MILAVVLLMAGTLLTTSAVMTMVPAAYAGENYDDGNQQKAEDESQAAFNDCDENEVERAGFDCIAIAESEVEMEPPEESATLSVCKEITGGSSQGTEPDDFVFTVTGNGPSDDEFEGDADCVDVTIGPGEYTVSEVIPPLGGRTLDIRIEEGSDCEQDPFGGIRAIGEIEAGETQECRFINSLGD
jgi:hypothetical protein